MDHFSSLLAYLQAIEEFRSYYLLMGRVRARKQALEVSQACYYFDFVVQWLKVFKRASIIIVCRSSYTISRIKSLEPLNTTNQYTYFNS
jgi:hypothetical protein